jgi:hypothetical protein
MAEGERENQPGAAEDDDDDQGGGDVDTHPTDLIVASGVRAERQSSIR